MMTCLKVSQYRTTSGVRAVLTIIYGDFIILSSSSNRSFQSFACSKKWGFSLRRTSGFLQTPLSDWYLTHFFSTRVLGVELFISPSLSTIVFTMTLIVSPIVSHLSQGYKTACQNVLQIAPLHSTQWAVVRRTIVEQLQVVRCACHIMNGIQEELRKPWTKCKQTILPSCAKLHRIFPSQEPSLYTVVVYGEQQIPIIQGFISSLKQRSLSLSALLCIPVS